MLEWNVGKNHFTISISMVAGNKVHHGSKKLQLDQSFLKIKALWNYLKFIIRLSTGNKVSKVHCVKLTIG